MPYSAQTDFSGNGANGLLAHFAGEIYFDDNSGVSIQPLATGPNYQLATGSGTVGSPPYARGSFIPNDINCEPTTGGEIPGYGYVPSFDPGNYGLKVAAIGMNARVWDLTIGPTRLLGAAGPMPFIGGTSYAVASQIWGMLSGYQDIVSGLGTLHTDLETAFNGGPFPLVLSGTYDARNVRLQANGGVPLYTPGAGVATYDGATLTIHVSGTVKYTLDDGAGFADVSDDIDDTRVLTGVLVYHSTVPEPSSLGLLGIGVVGLLSCAWRARKRRP